MPQSAKTITAQKQHSQRSKKMDLRVLEYFLAVSREKSFSAAAEVIHISQPTLSRQIADLEKHLGKQLLIRNPKNLQLTDEGRLLKERAEEILSLVAKTENEIRTDQAEMTADLYVGAGETPGVHLITLAAANLRKKFPKIRLHISSGDSADLNWQLDHGLIDLALLFSDPDQEQYICVNLPHQDVQGVYMRKDDPLAEKEKIRPVPDLYGKPLIVNRGAGNELLPGIPISQFEISGTYSLLYNASLMAEDGIGYVIGLEGIIHTEGTDLCFRPFETDAKAQLKLVRRKQQILTRPLELYLEEINQLIHAE